MGVKVQSLKRWADGWRISWPWAAVFTSTTLQLKMRFKLVLQEGTKADCLITQDKMGDNMAGTLDHFPAWVPDSPLGQRLWWDGDKWGSQIESKGEWENDQTATWIDEPGYDGVPLASYPLFCGGAWPARSGYFMFRTTVWARDAVTVLAQATWGLQIDYSAPAKGSHLYFV
jgi:hypothetical protein